MKIEREEEERYHKKKIASEEGGEVGDVTDE